LTEDDVAKRLVAVGVAIKGSTPEAFDDFLLSEYKRWNAVREAAHIEQQ
jgi:tripartite-type tricarboxylate transporter receptor subunit TctC